MKYAIGFLIGFGLLLVIGIIAAAFDPATVACWHTDPFSNEEASCYLNYYLENQ